MDTNEPINVSIPTECHLWSDKPLTREAIHAALERVTTYEDESHLIRTLLRCRRCGHLYFHEFYEVVDWQHGNDAQYSSWIPVDDAESAERLSRLSPFALLGYAAIRIAFPSDAAQPS